MGCGHLVVGFGVQEVLHAADDILAGGLAERQRPDAPLRSQAPCLSGTQGCTTLHHAMLCSGGEA